MYLNYSNIESWQMRRPVLRLQTLAGKNLGAIQFAHNIKFDINYSDVSEISFDVPYMQDGQINPIYAALTSYKVIYTESLGIYVLSTPKKSGDGVKEVKSVHGYSLEKLFEKKRLFLEEGTYDFWNPAHPDDTILGRIREVDPTWDIGTVAPRLIGCYRTFDEYDSDPLTFCYSNAAEKYQCVVVFDVYNRTINAYDGSTSRGTLPIYLSYENLVNTVGVDELTDEIVTKLHVYGADDLTIRDVNPTGSDYLVDLSFFIQNGDLDITLDGGSATLAERVAAWKAQIASKQVYYTGLVAARSSKTAQRIAAEAELAALRGNLETLTAQQSAAIQGLALDPTSADQQTALNQITASMSAKRIEITEKEGEIATLQAAIDEYAADIQDVHDELSYSGFFTEEERNVLNQYLIEDGVTEDTFVATDVDTSVSGAISHISGTVTVTDGDIHAVDIDSSANNNSQRRMHSIAGGKITITNTAASNEDLSADIVRGTLECNSGSGSSGSYVLTAYLGATTYGNHTFPSGMITLSGNYTGITSDISAHVENDVTEYIGTRFTLNVGTSASFFTVNVTDYQKYSVEQELYEYGEEVLNEKAWPIYEFQIGSGNFLFQKEFAPFKNKLELGKAVYLNLGSEGTIKANIIGLHLNYETPTDFSMTFSNRFQRNDLTDKWLTQLSTAASSSRSFDASKYIYNRAANKTAQVSQIIEGQLNAAATTIIGAANQTVIIDGAGIHVGGENSNDQIRITDHMIAMSDDGFSTAKIGIGRFAFGDDEDGVWGINAEMLAGKAVITNKFTMEDVTDEGVMLFKLDSSGAWLYNSQMVLQKENVGSMLFHPDYGIVAGPGTIYTTSGTTVKPTFIDENGDIVTDNDGMPNGANFFLDIRDGNAYFRGKVLATSGKIGGFTIENNYLHAGTGNTYVALNGSGSDNSTYAMWAGAESPASASFYVTRAGKLHAKEADFIGDTVLKGGITYSSSGASGSNNGWLTGCGIRVGANSNGYNFTVDQSGNVNMKGSITLAGNITWSTTSTPVKYKYSQYNVDYSSNPTAWHDDMAPSDLYKIESTDGGNTWGTPFKFRGEDGEDGEDGEVTRAALKSILNANDGLYFQNNTSSGSLLIKATAISAGAIDANYVSLGGTYGGFAQAEGDDGTSTPTKGAMMYGSSPSNYIIVTGSGARMTASGSSIWVISGACCSSSEMSVGSDRNLKEQIRYDTDRYEQFFDLLRPATFVLKGNANTKRHHGFIAQEVEDAMQESGLTHDDLGLLDIFNRTDESGEAVQRYSLRYGEMVSLCVHMIQKLRNKVSELEARLQ